MDKRVGELLSARRDVLKLGGYGLLGAFAQQAVWPVQARAAGKANPRGTARFVIVIELAGAISHIDTFDFKEGQGTPKDLDVRPVKNNLYLSHRLFPELSSEMDKVTVVRSMKSHEVVHFRGQYYTQAGRPLNPAQAAEIPSVGSVIAYELEGTRKDTDTSPHTWPVISILPDVALCRRDSWRRVILSSISISGPQGALLPLRGMRWHCYRSVTAS